MQKALPIIIFLLSLSGCWNYDTKDTSTGEVEIIDGHTLPPDPGEAGKETLLGIDSNNDGVRDDLERYIYHRFNGYEHAAKERAIALQYGRAVQEILVDPEHAWENKTFESMHKSGSCKFYYTKKYKPENIAYKIYDADFKDRAFNTDVRVDAYFKYQESLGGHTFTAGSSTLDKCDVDIDQLDE
ncbi:hypothetical protein WCX49_07335 [Sulfurimonas sp. HSL-1656]|uniref:hypothetical protein n=1 Tax=Thiomicrolovo subterrani TaxID=3131934 RepID=UPI0031F86537